MSQTVEIVLGSETGRYQAAMEAIFKYLEERGINKDGEKLTDLRFADDVAPITSTVKEMEIQSDNLNEESIKRALRCTKENKIHDEPQYREVHPN